MASSIAYNLINPNDRSVLWHGWSNMEGPGGEGGRAQREGRRKVEVWRTWQGEMSWHSHDRGRVGCVNALDNGQDRWSFPLWDRDLGSSLSNGTVRAEPQNVPINANKCAPSFLSPTSSSQPNAPEPGFHLRFLLQVGSALMTGSFLEVSSFRRDLHNGRLSSQLLMSLKYPVKPSGNSEWGPSSLWPGHFLLPTVLLSITSAPLFSKLIYIFIPALRIPPSPCTHLEYSLPLQSVLLILRV